MPDREKVIKGKVIKGLEICSAGEWDSTSGRDHTNCPYYPAGYTGCTCKLLMRDALVLLKEQEAVDKNTGEWKNGHCSCCGEDVASMLDTWTNVQNFPFCPICGAKMN